MHPALTVARSLSLRIPFPLFTHPPPLPTHTSLYIFSHLSSIYHPPNSPSLSVSFLWALSDLSTVTHQPSLHACICFLSLKNSNDGRAFTVFTSFKTNMWHSAVPAETFDGSALLSELSELPAMEHSCMLHYSIGQGTRKQMYEIQKKMKKKKVGKQELLLCLIHVLWHIN